MKHVFGKRNRIAILFRKIEAKCYKILGSVIGLFAKSSQSGNVSILVFPEFVSNEEFANCINKFAWSFPEDSGIEIECHFDEEKVNKEIEFDGFLKNQKKYFFGNKNIKLISSQLDWKSLKNATTIAVHKKRSRYSLKLLPFLWKVRIVDENYYALSEGNFWKFGYYDLLSGGEKEFYQKISSDNFRQFVEANKHKKEAYVFLTGPSFSSYPKFKFSVNSYKIVCNTIIKDTEFLDYIGGPDVITFADPVFHFSSCNYAHKFREMVIKTVNKFDCYIAVPAATVPLLIGNYPEIKSRIIGLRRSEKISFPSSDAMFVKPSGSIITFIMLPLATSLAEKVYILGADGRGKSENYFWKHNNKVQLENLKESVFTTHPSFFRDRDYADHYKEHCDYLEEVIKKGENEGTNYYSLTESFIPALKDRYIGRVK